MQERTSAGDERPEKYPPVPEYTMTSQQIEQEWAGKPVSEEYLDAQWRWFNARLQERTGGQRQVA